MNISDKVKELIKSLPVKEERSLFIKNGHDGGVFRSPQKGSAIEFLQHREYSFGDDFRQLDWKLYGKKEKFYIRERERESKINVYFLFDLSSSMGFNYQSETDKLSFSLIIGFTILYYFLNKNLKIGLIFVKDGKIDFHYPISTKGSFFKYLQMAETLKSSGGDNLNKMNITELSTLNAPGFIFVFSDFFEENIEKFVKNISYLREKQLFPSFFQILDPMERNLKMKEPVHLFSMETREEMEIQPFLLKKEYNKIVKEYNFKLKKILNKYNAGIKFLTTDMDLRNIVLDILRD